MSTFDAMAVLVTLTAAFTYVNYRYLKLPSTIGLMLMALAASLLIIVAGKLGWGGLQDYARALVSGIDFNKTVMHGFLSYLLFAGALHVDLNELAQRKAVVLTLATVGVIASTFLIGGLAYALRGLLGFEMSFVYCLLFGALISPTDPIAVLALMKEAKAPRGLSVKVAGESLLNDGIGVVVFTVLLSLVAGDHDVGAGEIAWLFIEEAVGGVLFGLAIGWVAYRLLRSVDDYAVEILITLALVTGGYAAAGHLHLSAPIVVVVAGLLIGNQGRRWAMSRETVRRLDEFWELVDEFLNAVLFVLIGFEVLILKFGRPHWVAGLLAIPLVLGARFASVGSAVVLLRRFTPVACGAVAVLTWGGLRGAISVAMALALPPGPEREILLAATYLVVLFSLVVQGLTMKKLLARLDLEEQL